MVFKASLWIPRYQCNSFLSLLFGYKKTTVKLTLLRCHLQGQAHCYLGGLLQAPNKHLGGWHRKEQHVKQVLAELPIFYLDDLRLGRPCGDTLLVTCLVSSVSATRRIVWGTKWPGEDILPGINFITGSRKSMSRPKRMPIPFTNKYRSSEYSSEGTRSSQTLYDSIVSTCHGGY